MYKYPFQHCYSRGTKGNNNYFDTSAVTDGTKVWENSGAEYTTYRGQGTGPLIMHDTDTGKDYIFVVDAKFSDEKLTGEIDVSCFQGTDGATVFPKVSIDLFSDYTEVNSLRRPDDAYWFRRGSSESGWKINTSPAICGDKIIDSYLFNGKLNMLFFYDKIEYAQTSRTDSIYENYSTFLPPVISMKSEPPYDDVSPHDDDGEYLDSYTVYDYYRIGCIDHIRMGVDGEYTKETYEIRKDLYEFVNCQRFLSFQPMVYVNPGWQMSSTYHTIYIVNRTTITGKPSSGLAYLENALTTEDLSNPDLWALSYAFVASSFPNVPGPPESLGSTLPGHLPVYLTNKVVVDGSCAYLWYPTDTSEGEPRSALLEINDDGLTVDTYTENNTFVNNITSMLGDKFIGFYNDGSGLYDVWDEWSATFTSGKLIRIDKDGVIEELAGIDYSSSTEYNFRIALLQFKPAQPLYFIRAYGDMVVFYDTVQDAIDSWTCFQILLFSSETYAGIESTFQTQTTWFQLSPDGMYWYDYFGGGYGKLLNHDGIGGLTTTWTTAAEVSSQCYSMSQLRVYLASDSRLITDGTRDFSGVTISHVGENYHYYIASGSLIAYGLEPLPEFYAVDNYPADEAEGVSIRTLVLVQFDKVLDTSTIDMHTSLTLKEHESGDIIPYDVVYFDEETLWLYLQPWYLAYNITVDVEANNGLISEEEDIPLTNSPYEFSFSTIADPVIPPIGPIKNPTYPVSGSGKRGILYGVQKFIGVERLPYA